MFPSGAPAHSIFVCFADSQAFARGGRIFFQRLKGINCGGGCSPSIPVLASCPAKKGNFVFYAKCFFRAKCIRWFFSVVSVLARSGDVPIFTACGHFKVLPFVRRNGKFKVC